MPPLGSCPFKASRKASVFVCESPRAGRMTLVPVKAPESTVQIGHLHVMGLCPGWPAIAARSQTSNGLSKRREQREEPDYSTVGLLHELRHFKHLAQCLACGKHPRSVCFYACTYLNVKKSTTPCWRAGEDMCVRLWLRVAPGTRPRAMNCK